MYDYRDLSASDIVKGLNNRDFSAVDICRQALAAAREDGGRLNAFISVTDEKALNQAESIDKRLQSGQQVGRLAGVPVAVKDNICYSGYPTTCGSKMLKNFIPPYDASIVKKLIEQDAIIIGKTNMDEFAMGSSSETSFYGPVHHPNDPEIVPGGSSGGSAAAVAAGIVPIAYGSDTGGSIRQPASFCGVYGLKPTYGAVSRYGLIAFASSMDQIGPMARNADDLMLASRTVMGYDENDSTSVKQDIPLHEVEKGGGTCTIGLPAEYPNRDWPKGTLGIYNHFIGALEDAGHKTKSVSLPHLEYAVAVYYIIANAEASSNLSRYDGIRYGPSTSTNDLIQMYHDIRGGGFGIEVKRRIMLGTYVLSAGYYDAYYEKACRVRELIKLDFEKAFEEVDLIMSPTTPTSAFRFGEKLMHPLDMYQSDIYTIPANLAGLPAISIPAGLDDKGYPVGVQLIAPELKESQLIGFASQ